MAVVTSSSTAMSVETVGGGCFPPQMCLSRAARAAGHLSLAGG